MSGYYRLEPDSVRPAQCCEQRVEVELADGTLLRGYIDRIDVAATGLSCRWSTTRLAGAAGARALFKTMFQMKFYAVALFRSRGVPPAAAAHLSGRR